MTRLYALLVCLILSACVSIPGEDVEPATFYTLMGPGGTCSNGGTPLALSVIKVASGLDTDHVARVDAGTGEYTYLRGVRWVGRSGSVVEQRLAADLECRGHPVITSHHAQLHMSRLVCEVRALNLVRSGGGDSAEVSLSCVQFHPGGKQQRPILASASTPLRSWEIDNAMDALAQSYARVLKELVSQL